MSNFSSIQHLLENPKKNKTSMPKINFKMLALIIAIAGMSVVSTAYYFTDQSARLEAQKLEEDKKLEESDPKKYYLEQISKLIELPNEDPTMMSVAEKEKLADNPFFKRAENDDKVFIFKSSSKALIYRPSTNKVIEYVTANIEGNPEVSSNTSTGKVAGASDNAKSSVKLSILNGTGTAGLAAKTESLITSKISTTSFEVLQKANANSKSYTKTQVIDVSKKFPSTADAISKALNASVVSMPSGESAPSGTDILVIAAQ